MSKPRRTAPTTRPRITGTDRAAVTPTYCAACAAWPAPARIGPRAYCPPCAEQARAATPGGAP